MAGLDAKDLRILARLMEDASISNRDLARALGLAESSTLERVRRLRRDGVIRGQHADIDLGALGARLEVLILIRLTNNARESVEHLRDHLLKQPEVRSVFLVSGEFDFLVHAAVRDSDHVRRLELDRVTSRPEVDGVRTLLIFEHAANFSLPVEGPEDV